MWFDPHAKLAEIAGQPPATSATTATQSQTARPVSQVSQSPGAQKQTLRVANVATVATPEASPHGLSVSDSPLTWTARIVSLDEWRRLTEWERHGAKGSGGLN